MAELEVQVFSVFCRAVGEACWVCVFHGGIGAGESWASHRKRAPGKAQETPFHVLIHEVSLTALKKWFFSLIVSWGQEEALTQTPGCTSSGREVKGQEGVGACA